VRRFSIWRLCNSVVHPCGGEAPNCPIAKLPNHLDVMALYPRTRRPSSGLNQAQGGYILLSLLLMVALLVIAAAAVLPSISFEIRRDREQELIHRGVQYSRAIRSYYKKFGRYPTRIEELESTNNLRFLRKRYKDPITGQDFKLLHFGEVKMAFSAPLAGASNINGTTSLNNPAGFGSQVQPGGPPAGGSFAGTPTGFAAATKEPSTPDSVSTTDPNQPPNPNSSSSSSPASSDQPAQPPGATSSDKVSGQTFGGGPVVGVVSASTKDSIREFNHKKKYNEWQFIYDPGTDRGGLLTTPNQPPLQGFGNQNQPGPAQQQGNPNGNSFGSPVGLNSGQASPGGAGTPPIPPGNPPDQQ
jgi:type II secretory pathway pseudopilin PulG